MDGSAENEDENGKKNDQKIRDDLIHDIQAFIQRVYTGDKDLEEQYLQCLIQEDAVSFDDTVPEDSEIPAECFNSRMIKSAFKKGS